MKWISTKEEELPKNNSIVFTKYGGIANAYFNEKLNCFCIETFAGMPISIDEEITHWMPLPTDPK